MLSGSTAIDQAATVSGESAAAQASGAADRALWVSVVRRLSSPMLDRLAQGQLKTSMPVEAASPDGRRPYTHLEGFGRLLVGIAPWLELRGLAGDEAALQTRLLGLARTGIDKATDPRSPDFMNFTTGNQPLVDAAFLAQALMRAPAALRDGLDARVRAQLVTALKSSRAIPTPANNNWVMFAATVETALLEMGETPVEERLEACVRRMLGWYLGDGAYGDGEYFHFDYYNSFVIQPMLIDVLDALRRRDARFEPALAIVVKRAQRYAEVQERLIAPDGTYPPIGRSITYRFGAFQTLAHVALRRQLPENVKPAQVRPALTAVIRRMIDAPGTFDANGWLQLGFCGHQPALAETYISTGSLYLCSVGLLPLGLPSSDPFWADPPLPWTSQKVWSGVSLPADHAMADVRAVDVPTLMR